MVTSFNTEFAFHMINAMMASAMVESLEHAKQHFFIRLSLPLSMQYSVPYPCRVALSLGFWASYYCCSCNGKEIQDSSSPSPLAWYVSFGAGLINWSAWYLLPRPLFLICNLILQQQCFVMIPVNKVVWVWSQRVISVSVSWSMWFHHNWILPSWIS